MKNKNVLITGCAGFIGSHATDLFLDDGYNVIGVDSLTYAGKVENILEALKNKKFNFYQNDICNTKVMKKLIDLHEIDWIINFAAETHVDNSIASASSFVKSNVDGVRSLLDCCINTNVKFLQISTDEVYGSINNGSFSENDEMKPKNPYSATKAAAEHLVKAYNNTFGIDYLIVRMSNNFGPRQHKEKLIPTVLNSLARNTKIPIYGDGKNIRDWFYVKDCAKMLKLTMETGSLGNIYNLTNCQEFENVQIIRKICELSDHDYESSIEFVKDRLGHDFRYSIDNKKIDNLLKSKRQVTDLNKALKETIVFYNL
jgi:dTDP-glucose 4,6-dehydratase